MSDNVTVVAMVCVTALGMTVIVFIGTYLKDRLTINSKLSVKDIGIHEVAVTSSSDNKTKN